MPPSKRAAAPAVERAFIYCRQSQTSGDGERSVSLASQERLLRDMAEERGMVIVGVEIDADLRGWRDEHERPGLRNALERARAGEYDALLFYDISRVARDVFLLERLVRDLGRHNVRPVSLKEPQIEDPFYRQILAAIAEKYTRDLAAHARRGIAELTRRGVHHGLPPFGYRLVDRATRPEDMALPLPDRALVPDVDFPERIVAVQYIFDRFVAGASIIELLIEMRARNLQTAQGTGWSHSGVRNLLGNTAYVGDLRIGDTYIPDTHEPLISRDLFDRAQVMLEPRRRHKRKRKPVASWLEGVLLHECGQRAYLVAREGSPYFRCNQAIPPPASKPNAWTLCALSPKSVMATVLEDEVWSIVTADLKQIVDADRAIARAEEEYARTAPDASRERQRLAKDLQRLDDGLARAEALYLDGGRTRDWLNAYETRQAGERAMILARQAALPPEPEHDAIRDAASIMRNIADELHTISPEGRRVIMARLGVASFGPSGVCMWYAPEIAALIPGARTWMTFVAEEPGAVLRTSLRRRYEANAAALATFALT